jgi:hypothetical protein
MEVNMSNADPVTIPDDLVTIPKAAELVNRPYTSVYSPVRKGHIAVHFIAGDTVARVSLSEVKEYFKTVPRRFSAPTFRIVRHEEEPVAALPEKEDLFS